jgi:hypothetical protein
MKFAFSGEATLRHMNARKEGPEDNPELAVDLKFEAAVDASLLAAFEPALVDVLYLDSGAVRNIQLLPLAFSAILVNYRLEAFGSFFGGVELRKFAFKPVDGRRLSVTFAASFKPSGDEVARFAEYLTEAFIIDLRPEDGELDLQEPI